MNDPWPAAPIDDIHERDLTTYVRRFRAFSDSKALMTQRGSSPTSMRRATRFVPRSFEKNSLGWTRFQPLIAERLMGRGPCGCADCRCPLYALPLRGRRLNA